MPTPQIKDEKTYRALRREPSSRTDKNHHRDLPRRPPCEPIGARLGEAEVPLLPSSAPFAYYVSKPRTR